MNFLCPSAKLCCSIHQGILFEPATTSCSHIFCKQCISRFSICPLCSSFFTIIDLSPYPLSNIISALFTPPSFNLSQIKGLSLFPPRSSLPCYLQLQYDLKPVLFQSSSSFNISPFYYPLLKSLNCSSFLLSFYGCSINPSGYLIERFKSTYSFSFNFNNKIEIINFLFRSILLLHENGFAHCNLTLESVVISVDDDSMIKLGNLNHVTPFNFPIFSKNSSSLCLIFDRINRDFELSNHLIDYVSLALILIQIFSSKFLSLEEVVELIASNSFCLDIQDNFICELINYLLDIHSPPFLCFEHFSFIFSKKDFSLFSKFELNFSNHSSEEILITDSPIIDPVISINDLDLMESDILSNLIEPPIIDEPPIIETINDSTTDKMFYTELQPESTTTESCSLPRVQVEEENIKDVKSPTLSNQPISRVQTPPVVEFIKENSPSPCFSLPSIVLTSELSCILFKGRATVVRIDDHEIVTFPINLYPVVSIAAGFNHFVLLTSEGYAYTVGENSLGQCGHPSSSQVDLEHPFKINIPGVVAVSASETYTLLLTNNGKVYQIGTWNNIKKVSLSGLSTPVLVDLEDVSAIKASGNVAFALSSGELMNWTPFIVPKKKSFQTGRPSIVPFTENMVPTQFLAVGHVAFVVDCAGRLFNGKLDSRLVGQPLLENVAKFAIGFEHIVAMQQNSVILQADCTAKNLVVSKFNSVILPDGELAVDIYACEHVSVCVTSSGRFFLWKTDLVVLEVYYQN
ncbi:hypothetical protein RCL1_005574 [Eukaryota sp. TZLM3-RCL]